MNQNVIKSVNIVLSIILLFILCECSRLQKEEGGEIKKKMEEGKNDLKMMCFNILAPCYCVLGGKRCNIPLHEGKFLEGQVSFWFSSFVSFPFSSFSHFLVFPAKKKD